MTQTKQRRALIIGGSLGGLFTATTLRAIGWDVHIFERSAHDLDSRGGGVVLQADVLAAFRFAGIDYDESHGVPSGDRIYLGAGDAVLSRQHMPQTQTSWNSLYSAMNRSLPPELTSRAERFMRYEQHGDEVVAYFESGRVERADLLIGADGPKSSLRAQVLPGVMPTYAGYVAWRGLVPETSLSTRAVEMLQGTFAFQHDGETMMLEYMVPGEDGSIEVGKRRWNWVWYRKVSPGADLQSLLTDRNGKAKTTSLYPGAVQDAYLSEMRHASKLLAPTFQDLVEATAEPFVQAILDMRVPQMVFGRALVVGDAASIPRPHTAGSTAKAAANALSLAHALSQGENDIDAALQAWEFDQLLAARQMTEWGMRAGDRIMGIPRTTAAIFPRQP
ncbi:hypothetical protein F3J24_20175 [Comamonas sp. Tr-654]|uniref:FAD binding domain-containing protein n=1 Tax=Comamonas sp. Tr-654 TaxID=2608341 RepID=UPI00142194C7|nr:FAD binding domain-containing protein [Comamonas sp. Tr-654]NIF85799.1 hypothetical protein [Comamonas sp. Tr-654]